MAKLAAAVEATPQSRVAEYASQLLLAPRLLVHVFGNPHESRFDEDDGSGATLIDDVDSDLGVAAWRAAHELWQVIPPPVTDED